MHSSFQGTTSFWYIFILKVKYYILLQILLISHNISPVSHNFFPMQLTQEQNNEVVKLPTETIHKIWQKCESGKKKKREREIPAVFYEIKQDKKLVGKEM